MHDSDNAKLLRAKNVAQERKVKNVPEKMTIDKLIEICESQYKRGAATAKYSKYDQGYANAFRLCLTFAKQVKGVPEARWKGAGFGDYTCSKCNETQNGRSTLCPSCLSLMDYEEAAADAT